VINFSDGIAEMFITELDHEFLLAKQSPTALIRRASRHGFCVELASYDAQGRLASNSVGDGRYR
jgi:hypothetical protein